MFQILIRILFILLLLQLIISCNNSDPNDENVLRIPTLIDTINHDVVNLELKASKHEFYKGIKSDTKGINSSYLGPTIKLYQGTTAKIQYKNLLKEKTTIHGHGLHVNGDVDGGPQQVINPGQTRSIEFPVQQQAGMSWYHPHLMGKTAEHVHAGLAGIYIIEDENSKSLSLPNIYATNDIPLVIQDRTFSNGVMRTYHVTHKHMMDGLREDTLVVNGTINAYKETPRSWVRLRLLNGSNARFYRFYFSDDASFYKIATEGGFLNSPVLINELIMAPGERNEIMIDLSNIETISLMAEFLPADPEDQLFFLDWFNKHRSVVKLKTNNSILGNGSLPKKLNDIKFFTDSHADKATIRNFALEMDDDGDMAMDIHNMFTINGKSMNMNRIDERVNKGDLETWIITAEMMPHPFHVHGVSFQILSHLGNPPNEADKGWKDTVIVGEQPTKVIMRFNHEANDQNPYMYHCHILEHEDGGMMGQFTVQ